MSKVITFSRVFPKGHPKQGLPTNFVEAIYKCLFVMKTIPKELEDTFNHEMFLFGFTKGHTIRNGNRFKKGDFFSPRVWSDKPYRSKQIKLCEDVEVKKTYDIIIYNSHEVYIDGTFFCSFGSEKWEMLCSNDGLNSQDMRNWFSKLPFTGQIICWNENIEY